MTLRRLAGETMIYGTGYILGKVLNYLLITVYLTWKFDGEQDQYGLYTDFYFYVALILVLLTLRMETTFFRFGSETGQTSRAFGQAALTLTGTALLWTAFVVLCKDPIAAALQYPGYETHVLVLGLILTMDVLVAIPFASLRLEQRPVRFAVLKIAGIAINIVAVLVFLEVLPRLAAGGSDWAARMYNHDNRLLYVFMANLIGSASVFLFFLPRYLKVRWVWDPVLLRKMLAYTLPLIVVGLAGVINQSSYITFQKHILPNSLTENLSAGGVYAAATRIAIIMSLFITAFNYAAEPFFFQHARHKDAKTIYADVARAFAVAGSVLFVVIMMYLDVIQLILGRSFREGLAVVPILLLAFFFLGLYYNFSIWYKITDRTRYGALISGIGAIITIVLNVLLIRELEVIGSAWAALACYVFMAGACYLIGRKFFPVPYRLGRILILISLACLTFFASESIRPLLDGQLWLILLVNTGLLILFVGIVYRLEKGLIRSVVQPTPGPSLDKGGESD
ncbi:MAG: oligosaccharide flippase family protein [Saprospiraceae bacterium]|nr:oligosaccharide flippase family protein [Saprospiraceae bacterium]